MNLNLDPNLDYYYYQTNGDQGSAIIYVFPEEQAKRLFSNFKDWTLYQKSSKDPDQLELFTEEQLRGD